MSAHLALGAAALLVGAATLSSRGSSNEAPSVAALRQALRDRYPRGPVHTIPPNQYWVYECAAGLPASAQTIVAGQ